MDIKLFEEFERQLRNTKCPEQLFGDIGLSTDIAAYKKARDEKYDYLQKIIKNPTSANEEVRVSMILSLFLLLDKWGLEKVTKGFYGNNATYRLKLSFQVKKWNKKHRFFWMGENFFHSSEIPGYHFGESSIHSDTVHVLRKGVPIKKGFTSGYGTHGATTCFYNIYHEGPAAYLRAKDFQLLDVVEIETWQYGSLHEFLQVIK